MVAISTDEWSDIRYRQEQLLRGLVFLADPEGWVIAEYGLEDETLGEDVARPATFVLDGDGVIQWRHLPSDWRRRLGAVDYLKVFDAIDRGMPVPELDEAGAGGAP